MSSLIPTPAISAQSGLQCPTLYSNEMLVRFIDGKLCIIRGATMVGCICLKPIYIPISVWSETTMVMDPGEMRKVELGMIADFGKRREIYAYELLMYIPGSPQVDVQASLNVTCTAKLINESVNFYTGTTFTDTIKNLKSAINSNTKIKNEIEIINEDVSLKSFEIRAVNKGYSFGYTLEIDSTEVPITSIQTALRYPHGRCKFIFIQPSYIENVIPLLSSNDKHIQFAYDDDYQTNGANATFRNIGKIFLNSSDDDVEESDTNLIETVWLKNTHSKALQIQVLIAS